MKRHLTALLVALALPTHGLTEEPPEPEFVMYFSGIVEPSRRATLAPQVNGTVAEVLIDGGERVTAGQVLFRLDSEPYRIEAALAEAAVAEAEATYKIAQEAAERQSRLAERNVGTPAQARDAALSAEAARARLAAAEAELARVRLSLQRTEILAPFDGIAGRPLAETGDFVEAEAGAILGEIVVLDVVHVAYQVPHDERLAALERADATRVAELFARLSLTLELPGGRPYPHEGKPLFESVALDETTGNLVTWAAFPNPDGLLAPGLPVRVTSTLRATQ